MQTTTFGAFPAAGVLAAELDALADPAVTHSTRNVICTHAKPLVAGEDA